MKGFIILTLFSVIFVSDYAFAQVCPCDTAELSNGTTGNDIVELLCPGGEPGEGTFFELRPDDVAIGNDIEDVAYVVQSFPDDGICSIGQLGVGQNASKLNPQEALICRNSLIERCSLNVNPIPTLSQWGMIATAGVLGIIGLFFAVRRRRAAA